MPILKSYFAGGGIKKSNNLKPQCLLVCLIGIAIILLGVPGSMQAQTSRYHQSSNDKYQAIKIKHRAQQGFTNHGRVLYHHVTDRDVTDPESGEIGNVRLQHGNRIVELENGNVYVGSRSGVKEIHSAVSLNKAYRFKDEVKIGNIMTLDPGMNLNGSENIVKIRREITVSP